MAAGEHGEFVKRITRSVLHHIRRRQRETEESRRKYFGWETQSADVADVRQAAGSRSQLLQKTTVVLDQDENGLNRFTSKRKQIVSG